MPVTDKQIATELLAYEKMMVTAYAQTISETSCPELRQGFQQLLSHSIQNVAGIGQVMTASGWTAPRYALPDEVIQVAEQATQTNQNLQQAVTAWQAAEASAMKIEAERSAGQ
ncbi:spore coat protein [Aneurinibacillus aneurinilyticus]|uniref:spore coat protein n=1 Tax=Aneurinibacillus aneurinilyticus TaxID=1391 RepID=UPI0035244CA7